MEVSLAVKDLDPLGLCSIVPLWNFVPKDGLLGPNSIMVPYMEPLDGASGYYNRSQKVGT